MRKKAVLLINLGSPDSPSVPDVRRYLKEFLMDERVIDLAWLPRALLVHGCILPFRPKHSAEAYRSIWTKEGSPLVVISKKVQQMLQTRVKVPVELAMRYQNPSVQDAFCGFLHQEIEEVLLIPLFPHYAMSSYETAVEHVRRTAELMTPLLDVEVVPPYFDDPDYITALVASAREYLGAEFDHLLFSYHGLPERHLRKSDPTHAHCLQSADCCETDSPAHATCYRAQCFKTTRAFARQAGLAQGKYSVAFQSRLGRDPWLQPYTEEELRRLAKSGVRRLLVMCPAFVSDCLETLEEIGQRGKEVFLGAGGQDFRMIPCLNDHPRWIEALERMVRRFTSGEAQPGHGCRGECCGGSSKQGCGRHASKDVAQRELVRQEVDRLFHTS